MTKSEIAELIDQMPQNMDVNDFIHELVNRALAVEREACAKVVEADGLARGNEGLVLIKAAGRIRARGVDTVNMSQERVDELKECVHEFFTKYLNHVEESDSGKLFNPVTIGCCRALMLEPLNELLERMRVLSGADRNPLSTDGIDGAKVGEVGVWGER